jgi:hypothetical protein
MGARVGSVGRLLAIVLALAVYGLVLFGLVSGLMGPAADEVALSTVVGRIEGLRIDASRDGAPLGYTFSVVPATGSTIALHGSSYGDRHVVRGLSAAAGRTVTVRYCALPLGNRVFAIAGPGHEILAFANARAFLVREHQEKLVDYQNGLILFLGVPFLCGAVALVRRWTKPRETGAAGSDQQAIDAHRLRMARLLLMASMGLVALVLVRDGFARPAMMRPLVGALGPRTLGLAPGVALIVLLLAGLAPIAAALWSLAGALHHSRRIDGVTRAGKLSIVLGIYKHWGDADVRRDALRCLMAFTIFVALTAAWIMVTARAGV